MSIEKGYMTFKEASDKSTNIIKHLLDDTSLIFKDILTLRDLYNLCNEINSLFTKLHELKFNGSFEDLTTCVNVLTTRIDDFVRFINHLKDFLDEIKYYELKEISNVFSNYAGLPQKNEE